MIIINTSLLESMELIEDGNYFDVIISIRNPNSNGYIPNANLIIDLNDNITINHLVTTNFLDVTLDKIKETKINNCKKMLISCHSGVSRSPAILLMILISVLKIEPKLAVKSLYNINPDARPNRNIIKQYMSTYKIENLDKMIQDASINNFMKI